MDEEPQGWLLRAPLSGGFFLRHSSSSFHSLLLPRSLCTCQHLNEGPFLSRLALLYSSECHSLPKTLNYLLICWLVHRLSPLLLPERKGFIFFAHLCTRAVPNT